MDFSYFQLLLTMNNCKNSKTYTHDKLSEMNKHYPWTDCINMEYVETTPSLKYKLHPTGNATLSGRIYVALEQNTHITKETIGQYNLM